MSHFYESLHPDDVPDWHQGEYIPDDEPEDVEDGGDDADERTD